MSRTADEYCHRRLMKWVKFKLLGISWPLNELDFSKLKKRTEIIDPVKWAGNKTYDLVSLCFSRWKYICWWLQTLAARWRLDYWLMKRRRDLARTRICASSWSSNSIVQIQFFSILFFFNHFTQSFEKKRPSFPYCMGPSDHPFSWPFGSMITLLSLFLFLNFSCWASSCWLHPAGGTGFGAAYRITLTRVSMSRATAKESWAKYKILPICGSITAIPFS